jgi:hypothetical protein
VAVFHALKRVYFGVLVHISISQNGPILTEVDEPPPPGTCNKNPQLLGNAVVVCSGLSRVEESVFRCISTYKYRPKWPNTHGGR